MKPVTCDEQEERLAEAEKPREPLRLIGKRVHAEDEIGDENLVPNTDAQVDSEELVYDADGPDRRREPRAEH